MFFAIIKECIICFDKLSFVRYDKSMIYNAGIMMAKHMAKIAITIDSDLLERLDVLISKKYYKNRSQAIQKGVQIQVEKFEHLRLAAECDKLDPLSEQTLADQGLEQDFKEWPDY